MILPFPGAPRLLFSLTYLKHNPDRFRGQEEKSKKDGKGRFFLAGELDGG
jgi:hypothetical protein